MGDIVEFKKDDKNFDNIEKSDDGNLIQEIHDYYFNNAMLMGIDILPDHVFDNIDSIMLIKWNNNIIKNKFIISVDYIKKLNLNVINELELVSDLVEIFFYLSDKIIEYDSDTINKILQYKNLTKKDIEEVFSSYEENSEIKGKM